MIGQKKISALPTLTRDNTELVPVIQDDGAGGYINGVLPIADANQNIYNSDGTLTGSRVVDLDGNSLTFDGTTNGLIVNTTTAPCITATTTSGYGVWAVSADVAVLAEGDINGVYGISTSGYGGNFASINSIGCAAVSANGQALVGNGNSQIATNGSTTSQNPSAVLQLESTTQGLLTPRMTTTQRNAIASPATGLEIYNTTTNRKEVYNGTFWQGISMRFMQVFFTQWNPADAQTVVFGSVGTSPQLASTSPAPFEIVMRGNGVIRGCDFTTFAAGVDGSNENWSLYVRHNGTDYLVQTVSSTAKTRTFTNTSLNIPYVAGDIVRMVFVNPTWATNPTQVGGGGFLTLQ